MFDSRWVTQTPTRSLAQMQELLREHEREQVGATLPVHPRLAPAFPHGLRAGAVYAVSGSVSIGLALLAGASQQRSWCVAVGTPHLSIEAADRWGVDLDQMVLVPSPGRAVWDAVGTLVDAADLILTAAAPVAPAQARRLEARLRARQTTLVVLGEWPQPAATLQVRTVGWTGLGQGSGCLTEQHLELTVTERHRRRTTRLTVPERP